MVGNSFLHTAMPKFFCCGCVLIRMGNPDLQDEIFRTNLDDRNFGALP